MAAIRHVSPPAAGGPSLHPARVQRHRRRLLRRFRVRTAAAARRFVERLGFCYAFTPGPGGIPGLFDVIGTRSTDRMWSWAWTWKDSLVTKRQIYYGRVLRRKPTFIALAYLPAFYALSGNVGEPDDYLLAYRAGHLSLLARELYEQIERQGPLDTWQLRRRFVFGGDSGTRLHRALHELQERFLIAKVAEVEGRGGYAYIWDTFTRWMPEVAAQAARISSEEAAGLVLRGYLRMVGATTPQQVADLFHWPPSLLQAAATRSGVVEVDLAGERAWTLPELLRRLA
ncbi:MAG: hypothetical protein QN152_03005 [Armatimonadota bacterium]|nr:hypothetical protein [Armatimonadota bacterium]MDR7428261.1 hypothetical protein [Armatimonadota bacterium]MDR7463233.1 hypothetical protein [Armatimonadota bacterium]MDR7469387.1 hypothetical protein [Armatimonadota bacterium]MDR7474777.1 hypothetical protein [Armatimonadota bacterium]